MKFYRNGICIVGTLRLMKQPYCYLIKILDINCKKCHFCHYFFQNSNKILHCLIVLDQYDYFYSARRH